MAAHLFGGTCVQRLAPSCRVLTCCMQTMLNTRAMDQIYKGKGGPLLYGTKDLPVSIWED